MKVGAPRGNKNRLIHGMAKTAFYSCWFSLVSRCINSKNRYYKNYGGRGIKVCQRWLIFENFRDDMHVAYLEHKAVNATTTIERKNNNGDYCLLNCRWATRREQSLNRRRYYIKLNAVKMNRILDLWKQNYSKSEIAKIFSVHPTTILYALKRGGNL